MKKSIKGSFEVTMSPLQSSFDNVLFGRLELDKVYYGPLEGKSRGEMLSARTAIASSAGYVALEQFTGTVDGKKGSMFLQHFGVMSAGKKRLILEVVPDSGTEELEGISGTMQIIREDGHEYVFEYEINS